MKKVLLSLVVAAGLLTTSFAQDSTKVSKKAHHAKAAAKEATAKTEASATTAKKHVTHKMHHKTNSTKK